MTVKPSFLAFDLGAESGRTILGTLDEGKLVLEELNRFPNEMLNLHGHWHWNVYRLFEEMKKGMKACSAREGVELESLGVDTWGVDFGLLGPDGSLLGLPYTYRDARTEGAMEAYFRKKPAERVYELTGIQFLPFNTLFQLFSMKRDASALLDSASDLLFMPDVFNYLFTGVKATEFTFATTSQLYNPKKGAWEEELFQAMDVAPALMQKIVEPGTVLGPLYDAVASETGLPKVPVVAVASHDTGSAVAAVPAEGEGYAYISSGTWSLMGVEVKDPVINETTRELNFTNEGAVGGFRLLKNISGLWQLQQCRKAWSEERTYGYEELMGMASSSEPFPALIDPDHPDFLHPTDMPEAIARYCRATGQAAPSSHAALVRALLESLALKYRYTLDQLRRISKAPIQKIHIIGGGSRNALLCRFTADATGLPVVAGPAEATAAGNLMMQALALGHVRSLAGMRDVIRGSFSLQSYEPGEAEAWDEAYERFQKIVSRGMP